MSPTVVTGNWAPTGSQLNLEATVVSELFVFLAWIAFLVEVGTFGASAEMLGDPGRVTVPSGYLLRLTGARGHTLDLIFPVRGDPKADYNELSAQLRTGTADEILLPLHAELESSEETRSVPTEPSSHSSRKRSFV